VRGVDLSIFFAGTAGSVPSARRGLPALVVQRGRDRLLFDCGEGTQRQLLRSVGLAEFDAVFVTHFHADHWLGLPGMLKSFALRDRTAPLSVYGPRGLGELMSAMRIVYGNLPYKLRVVELDPAEVLPMDGYSIAAVPVRHSRENSLGYVIVEDPRPGEFDVDAARALGVTPGPDFGVLQRGEPVGNVLPEQVTGAPREGRKVVISGDTVPCEALAVAAHQADLLVHEATFAEDEADRARETSHSTARGVAELARGAEVRLLALTHISSRYAGPELRDEARAVFTATEVPRDFDTVEIPFPERGPAKLVRWSDRQARERPEGPQPPGASEAGASGRPAEAVAPT
jgi:ribonuclease Z